MTECLRDESNGVGVEPESTIRVDESQTVIVRGKIVSIRHE